MLEISGYGNVILREFMPIDDEEFNTYVNWLRKPEVIKYIGRKEYLLTSDKEEIIAYVHDLAKSPNDSLFKVYDGNSFVGTFKIGHINWETRTADMGIMIGEDEKRGKGLSKKIMRTGMRYAFETLGLWKLTGGCLSGNIAMQKCFEHCGYVQEGCVRKYMFVGDTLADHLLFGIFKDEFDKFEEVYENENM